MANITEEELTRIIYKGYHTALGSCFDNKTLYVRGFLDGIKFQKGGTILGSNFDKMLEKFENDAKN